MGQSKDVAESSIVTFTTLSRAVILFSPVHTSVELRAACVLVISWRLILINIMGR